MKQDDTDLVSQFERMEINMHNTFLMAEALCKSQGINVSSVSGEAHDGHSCVSSPSIALDMPLELDESEYSAEG